MSDPLTERTVFVISDSTGITAETFSHSVLSQFQQFQFNAVRIPFVDTVEKAQEVAERISACAQESGSKPLVFSTLVDPRIARIIGAAEDRKSTRLNSSHVAISYAVFCLKKKKQNK